MVHLVDSAFQFEVHEIYVHIVKNINQVFSASSAKDNRLAALV